MDQALTELAATDLIEDDPSVVTIDHTLLARFRHRGPLDPLIAGSVAQAMQAGLSTARQSVTLTDQPPVNQASLVTVPTTHRALEAVAGAPPARNAALVEEFAQRIRAVPIGRTTSERFEASQEISRIVREARSHLLPAGVATVARVAYTHLGERGAANTGEAADRRAMRRIITLASRFANRVTRARVTIGEVLAAFETLQRISNTEARSVQLRAEATEFLASFAVIIAESRSTALTEAEVQRMLTRAIERLRWLMDHDPTPARGIQGMRAFHLASLHRYQGDFSAGMAAWAQMTRLIPQELTRGDVFIPFFDMINAEAHRREAAGLRRDDHDAFRLMIEQIVQHQAAPQVFDQLIRAQYPGSPHVRFVLYELLTTSTHPVHEPLVAYLRRAQQEHPPLIAQVRGISPEFREALDRELGAVKAELTEGAVAATPITQLAVAEEAAPAERGTAAEEARRILTEAEVIPQGEAGAANERASERPSIPPWLFNALRATSEQLPLLLQRTAPDEIVAQLRAYLGRHPESVDEARRFVRANEQSRQTLHAATTLHEAVIAGIAPRLAQLVRDALVEQQGVSRRGFLVASAKLLAMFSMPTNPVIEAAARAALQPRSVASLTDVERNVSREILFKLGNRVFAGEPQWNPTTRLWEVPISTALGRGRVGPVHVVEVAKAVVGEDSSILSFPTREQVIEAIRRLPQQPAEETRAREQPAAAESQGTTGQPEALHDYLQLVERLVRATRFPLEQLVDVFAAIKTQREQAELPHTAVSGLTGSDLGSVGERGAADGSPEQLRQLQAELTRRGIPTRLVDEEYQRALLDRPGEMTPLAVDQIIRQIQQRRNRSARFPLRPGWAQGIAQAVNTVKRITVTDARPPRPAEQSAAPPPQPIPPSTAPAVPQPEAAGAALLQHAERRAPPVIDVPRLPQAQRAFYERSWQNFTRAAEAAPPGSALMLGVGPGTEVPPRILASLGKFPQVHLADVVLASVERGLRQQQLWPAESHGIQLHQADLSLIRPTFVDRMTRTVREAVTPAAAFHEMTRLLQETPFEEIFEEHLPFPADTFSFTSSSLLVTQMVSYYVDTYFQGLPANRFGGRNAFTQYTRSHPEEFSRWGNGMFRVTDQMVRRHVAELERVTRPDGVIYFASDVYVVNLPQLQRLRVVDVDGNRFAMTSDHLVRWLTDRLALSPSSEELLTGRTDVLRLFLDFPRYATLLFQDDTNALLEHDIWFWQEPNPSNSHIVGAVWVRKAPHPMIAPSAEAGASSEREHWRARGLPRMFVASDGQADTIRGQPPMSLELLQGFVAVDSSLVYSEGGHARQAGEPPAERGAAAEDEPEEEPTERRQRWEGLVGGEERLAFEMRRYLNRYVEVARTLLDQIQGQLDRFRDDPRVTRPALFTVVDQLEKAPTELLGELGDLSYLYTTEEEVREEHNVFEEAGLDLSREAGIENLLSLVWNAQKWRQELAAARQRLATLERIMADEATLRRLVRRETTVAQLMAERGAVTVENYHELASMLAQGYPLIPTDSLAVFVREERTGEVRDLRRLNALSSYTGSSGFYELLNDLLLAHARGFWTFAPTPRQGRPPKHLISPQGFFKAEAFSEVKRTQGWRSPHLDVTTFFRLLTLLEADVLLPVEQRRFQGEPGPTAAARAIQVGSAQSVWKQVHDRPLSTGERIEEAFGWPTAYRLQRGESGSVASERQALKQAVNQGQDATPRASSATAQWQTLLQQAPLLHPDPAPTVTPSPVSVVGKHDAAEAFTTIARHLPEATRRWLVWLATRDPVAYVGEFRRAALEARIPGDHLAFDETDGTFRWPAIAELPGQQPIAVEDRLPLAVQQQLLEALHVEDMALPREHEAQIAQPRSGLGVQGSEMADALAQRPQPPAQSQGDSQKVTEQDYLTMLEQGGIDPTLLAKIKQGFWGLQFLPEVWRSRVSREEVLAAADPIRELGLVAQRAYDDPRVVAWHVQHVKTIREILAEADTLYPPEGPPAAVESPLGILMEDAVNPAEAELFATGFLSAVHEGSQGNLTLPRDAIALFVPGEASGEAIAQFIRDRIPLSHVMAVVGPSAELAESLKTAFGQTSRPLVHVLVAQPAPDAATVPAIVDALAFAAALLAAATLEQVWRLAQAHQARHDGEAFLIPTVLVIPVDEGFRRYQVILRAGRSV